MKYKSMDVFRKFIVGMLVIDLFLGPGIAVAGRVTGIYRTGAASRGLPSVAANALPEINSFNASIEAVRLGADKKNRLVIIQTENGAVLKWDTFNIGEDAKVYFKQGTTEIDAETGDKEFIPEATWTALNRIYDSNPSQIYGQLTADGKIFLINQNGFLFGESARIGNMSTLVASSLNMVEDDLDENIYSFYLDDYNKQGDDNYTTIEEAIVENQGTIMVQSEGEIYLVAPNVVNSGSLDAPDGHAALVAGETVELSYDESETSKRLQRLAIVSANPGEATNTKSGSITARSGTAGIYGGVVNQDGLVTSVTAVYMNGRVELLASEEIHTGEDSTTGTPLSESGDTVDSSFSTSIISEVTLGGLQTGWDTSGSAKEAVLDTPTWIGHHGAIVSPSGMVSLEAEKRIFMADGSSVDVSGAWAARSASDNQIEVQLNSVELSDDFLARLGSLKGETIKFNALVGTDIGHIGGYLNQGQVTVQEQNTAGGTITMNTTAEESDIIMAEGARISFAGGGINYSAGLVETSKVRIGNAIYDIGDIPEDILEMADKLELVDDAIASRYGKTYIAGYKEGDDAGSLTLTTGTLVLNGELDGSVTRGVHQTLADNPTVTYEQDGDDPISYYTAWGLKEPEAGTLVVGYSGDNPNYSADRRIDAVVMRKAAAGLPAEFNAGADPAKALLDDATTYLSTDILNAAGLGSLKVAANTTIDIRANADLTLAASHGSGELTLIARRIDHRGTVTLPGGTVSFYNDLNVTSATVDLEELIHLYAGSLIDVSGETWDNWNDPQGVPDQMHLDGGTITLAAKANKNFATGGEQDNSQGLYIDRGAVVDVGGGYAVGVDGDVSGGDAGGLGLIGRSMVLDGTISGNALLGCQGGELTIESTSLGIVHAKGDDTNSSMTADTISDYWIGQSGFSTLRFSSDTDLTVANGVVLQPSRLKYTVGLSGLTEGGEVLSPDNLMEAAAIELIAGASTYTNHSGTLGYAVTIGKGAVVDAGNSGGITLIGPQIDIHGDLVALGGSISAEATETGHDVTLGSKASIDVSGYALQLSTSYGTGLPLPYAVYAGGTVSLEAELGNVVMADGALIDVSGSPLVTNTVLGSLGRRLTGRFAAEAGSISLQAAGFDLQGEFRARTSLENLSGGTLSIASTDYADPHRITRTALESYMQGGFDAWRFSSITGIQFFDDQGAGIDISATDDWVLRELILDAPMISAAGNQSVTIESIHAQIVNTDDKYIDVPEYEVSPTYDGDSTAALELAATWLDVTGSVAIDGFASIHLGADIDMTLEDVFYVWDSSNKYGTWAGGLATYADLKLTAGRIYPTTDTEFTISTGKVQDDGTWLGGGVEIVQSADGALDGPILSANGQITIQTNTLVHNGTLMAPMGRIILEGQGEGNQILLGADSVLSTESDAAVAWGYYESEKWLRIDKGGDQVTDTIEVDGMPERRIDIMGETVVAENGSVIDVSGGGMVYATAFEPSIAGSSDPLTAANRYVILPDNSVQLPGDAVYLTGIDGIEDGYYSLLPYDYAFWPDAVILIDLGSVADAALDYGQTIAGYAQGVGYAAVMGTDLQSTQAHLYAVRDADDVLAEGSYYGAYQVAGDGGALTIGSARGDLRATYYASGLTGYDGGQAWISSVNMILTSAARSELDETDTLYFDPQSLSDAGFGKVVFGYSDDLDNFADLVGSLADAFALLSEGSALSSEGYLTETLEVRDVDFTTAALGLYASRSIDIQSDVTIGGTDSYNELVMVAPDGTITVANDGTTTIEADAMGIFADAMAADQALDTGQIVAIAGSGRTELVDPAYASEGSPEEGVLRIYNGLYDQFLEADYVALAGTSGIHTVGQVATGSGGLLYLNAPQMTGSAYTDHRQKAQFRAASLWIDNGAEEAETTDIAGDITGSMTFAATYDADYEAKGLDTGQVLITGAVTLAGIETVGIVAQQDIVLAGEGSLQTGGDLSLSAGRVTADARYDEDDDDYQSADFTVTAGGLLSIDTLEGQAAGSGRTAGGILRFAADTIVHAGLIDNFAGGVALSAQNGLTLEAGSVIDVSGGIQEYTIADETVYQAYGAGWVTLSSAGALEIQGAGTNGSGNATAAARIDVGNSATEQPETVDDETWVEWLADGYLDAGYLEISAASAELTASLMAGEFTGLAADGAAGSGFTLDTGQLDDVGNLLDTLDRGGFDALIDLRLRNGDIDLAEGDSITAHKIRLTADSGYVYLRGDVDASGDDGGVVAVNAGKALVLYGAIDASATSADGRAGSVTLNAAGEFPMAMAEGSSINVSSKNGTGGSVHLRARQNAGRDDLQMVLNGTIKGASTITVEGVSHYEDTSITSTDIDAYHEDADAFLDHADTIQARLSAGLTMKGGTAEQLTIAPGIEVSSTGDLALNTAWDISDRGGSNQAGYITLRAAGDLTINNDLIDQPHSPAELLSDTSGNDSWNYTLVAGADLDSADALATAGGQGDFTISDQSLVFTESGDIRFASGGDTHIGQGQTRYYDTFDGAGSLATSYTLATYDGHITGQVQGNLAIAGDKTGSNAGVIQTAAGDIDLDIGGDLTLGYNSAIRTTGVTQAEVTEEMVAQDTTWSWLVTTTLDFTDPASGESITASYYDAIMTYSLQEQAGWEWLSAYETTIMAMAIGQFNTYDGGGDIRINVGGNAYGKISQYGFFRNYGELDAVNGADMAGASYVFETADGVSYKPASGIVAMAGGDVWLEAGGAIGAEPGSLGDADLVALGIQVAAFNVGDLHVQAGGDVDARLLIEDGRLGVMTMQRFGEYSTRRGIEVIDSVDGPFVTVAITAMDDISLGSVIDPLMATYWKSSSNTNDNETCSFHFTEETTFQLTSLAGGITLTGVADLYDADSVVEGALPATVKLVAGEDVTLDVTEADNLLWLTPGATGGLTVLAGGSIIGENANSNGLSENTLLIVSNLAPEQVYYDPILSGEYIQLTRNELKFDITGQEDSSNGFLTEYEERFDEWYSSQDAETRDAYQALYDRVHDDGYLLHADDDQALVLKAGGDIVNLALSSPKKTEITAVGDIRDNYFNIQHTGAEDVSVVAADGSISCSLWPKYYVTESESIKEKTYEKSGISLQGSGDLIVSAGHDIDLGESAGVRTLGNTYNDALSSEGADITLVSGYEADSLLKGEDGNWTATVVETFFDDLLDEGINYSLLKYGNAIRGSDELTTDIDEVRGYGEAYAALLKIYNTYADVPQDVRDQLAALYLAGIRETLIGAHLAVADSDESNGASTLAVDKEYTTDTVQGIDFDTDPEAGDLRMTQSQIYSQKYGDINTIVAGNFDVGVSSFSDKKSNTGINTMKGGDINIYTQNDLNVNESRVMTWFGGDIVIFADKGNINAGKGSKTTVSLSDPVKTYDPDTGKPILEYSLPAVGSGIRLLTYDPDGSTGAADPPDAGDLYLFAPEGEIDAGEAGIVGQGNILLTALVLTNTQNIAVGGVSAGASISQDAGAGIGSLAGTGGVADAANQATEETAIASAKERFSEYVADLSDSLVPKWLAVEVIGFGDTEGEDGIEEN